MKNAFNRKEEKLWKLYDGLFKIGAAVDEDKLPQYDDLLDNFNSLSPENQMKPCIIHPEKDVFDFAAADSLVNYAKEHSKAVRGHTLIWHNQNPDWIFNDKEAAYTSSDYVKIMENHIGTIMDRYRDSVFSWDVVNEILSDGNELLRDTNWKNAIGDTYVEKALCFAREANPKAELFINDYNIEYGEKSDKAIEYITSLKNKGVPIDGFGIQGHYRIYFPPLEEIRNFFRKLSKLDVKVQITELDVSMYRYEDNTRLAEPSIIMIDKQRYYYEELFKIYKEYRDIIGSVTFWGVADDYTWLDDFPVENRKDWPLLFDVNHKRKPAFDSICKLVC